IALADEPGPARTEVGDGVLAEGFLERVEGTPLGLDRVGEPAAGLAPATGLHAVPEEGVVPDLSGVVEDAALRGTNDLLEARVLELGSLDQVVQVRHVGLVVLAMVILEGL